MRFLLLIAVEDGPVTDEPTGDDVLRWVKEMDERGVRVLGNRVVPPAEATTVRVRNGDVVLTDGPFAETREQMAGFDIIECESFEEAIEVAAQHPVARSGLIEVRPFWEP
ncbi:YciI family protein [Dactylosporangium sucinum]|uniref:Transcription initiation protein n=1 Tax=Dactylosporangium sucinum TaxID=1424081 RepID=A0A917T653_9ACTN|nr:YciI family protein [Dactylosporangium sucinum]GGM09528.1 transcription initiation protein [Dactylosporangium sucinum]